VDWLERNRRVQAVEHQLTEGIPVKLCAVLEKSVLVVGDEEGGRTMSEQELIRLRALEDYQAAKMGDAVFRVKIAGMARLMSRVAIRILAGGPIDAEDLAKWPSGKDVAAAMSELKAGLEHLNQCRIAARNFGFPLESGE
jgi:hypothetical protein